MPDKQNTVRLSISHNSYGNLAKIDGLIGDVDTIADAKGQSIHGQKPWFGKANLTITCLNGGKPSTVQSTDARDFELAQKASEKAVSSANYAFGNNGKTVSSMGWTAPASVTLPVNGSVSVPDAICANPDIAWVRSHSAPVKKAR